MRVNKRHIILATAVLIILSQCALSLKVPTYISFQGKLSNSTSGQAYYPASIRVNITNQSQLTQVEWGPYTFNNVTDSQGVFSQVLGKDNQLNLTPGWQYQLVVEVDLNSETFTTTDLAFGDLNPSGDSILVTGGGPQNAQQLLMSDNVTSVDVHDHSGGGKGVSVLGPVSGFLNVSDKFYVPTGIQLGSSYITAWPSGGGVANAAWINVGSLLNVNSTIANTVNTTYLIVGSGLNVSAADNYLLNGAFATCGKLYTVGGKITCGTDAVGNLATQPNIDAANITSGIIVNQLLNTSYIVNQTFAAATYALKTDIGPPYWITNSGSTSSNISINSGNVNITGNFNTYQNTTVRNNKVICIGDNCASCMYWNSTHLIQESPCAVK